MWANFLSTRANSQKVLYMYIFVFPHLHHYNYTVWVNLEHSPELEGNKEVNLSPFSSFSSFLAAHLTSMGSLFSFSLNSLTGFCLCLCLSLSVSVYLSVSLSLHFPFLPTVGHLILYFFHECTPNLLKII